MDWQTPWLGSVTVQRMCAGGAVVFGCVMLSPWWFGAVQAWQIAHEAQTKLAAQQQATQDLLAASAQRPNTQNHAPVLWPDVEQWEALAQEQGLQLSHQRTEAPLQTTALQALQIQQIPLHFHARGSWQAWLDWLACWPRVMPGVAVVSLDITAQVQDGMTLDMVVTAPQSMSHRPSALDAGVGSDERVSGDLFSAQVWAQRQRWHAQQHPSYAALVAPELRRPREPLEHFARERLQYVGQISSGAMSEALVKVLPSTGGHQEIPMMTVHRVRVGHHLGPHFGRVLAIDADQLVVQEVFAATSGEWLTRHVSWPLVEAKP